MNYFTDEEDAYLKEGKRLALTVGEMARHLNRTEDSVGKRLWRLNGSKAKSLAATMAALKTSVDARRGEVLRMAREGMTTRQIAEVMALGKTLVQLHMRELRDAGELPQTYRSILHGAAETKRATKDSARLKERRPSHRVIGPRTVPAFHGIPLKTELGIADKAVPRVTLPGVEPYEPLTNVGPSRSCMFPKWPHFTSPTEFEFCSKPAKAGHSWCNECAGVVFAPRRAPTSVFVP